MDQTAHEHLDALDFLNFDLVDVTELILKLAFPECI
jgi:hypothetical protein